MNQVLKRFLLLVAVISVMLGGCKKDEILIPDNTAPPDSTISTIIIENYVNKCYISLLGREPIGNEEGDAVTILKDGNLNDASRDEMLESIVSKSEYTYRIVEFNSLKLLNAYDTTDVQEAILLYTSLLSDPQYAPFYAEIQMVIDDLTLLLAASSEFAAGTIGMQELHRRLVTNLIYDEINMGSFNYVLSMFNHFLFRDPTVAEHDAGIIMVDGFVAILMYETGNSKTDFIDIFLDSDDYFEGQVRELYLRYLFREPDSEEQNYHAVRYRDSGDFDRLQKDILSLDEFVGL